MLGAPSIPSRVHVVALGAALLTGTLTPSSVLASPPAAFPTGSSELQAPRIYGGEPVADGEYNEVVAVLVGSTLCSGVAISPRYVLTAAHCLDESPNVASIAVVFGNALNDQLPGSPVDAVRYEIHPDYCGGDCGGDERDFGFIELAQNISVPFPGIIDDQANYDAYVGIGDRIDLVGFGRDENGNQGVKRIVNVPLTKYSEAGTEFYAGGDGKDSCSGDSGGPAFVTLAGGERRLVGILSRGFDCGKGGVYGNPYTVACWLRERTGVDLVSSSCSACDCLTLHQKRDEDAGCGGCDLAVPRQGQRHDGGSAQRWGSTDSWAAAIGLGALLTLLRLRRRRAALRDRRAEQVHAP